MRRLTAVLACLAILSVLSPFALASHTRVATTSEDGLLQLFAQPTEYEEAALACLAGITTTGCSSPAIGLSAEVRIGGERALGAAVETLIVDWGDGTIEHLEEKWFVDVCFDPHEYPTGCGFTHAYPVGLAATDYLNVTAIDATGRVARLADVPVCTSSTRTLC